MATSASGVINDVGQGPQSVEHLERIDATPAPRHTRPRQLVERNRIG